MNNSTDYCVHFYARTKEDLQTECGNYNVDAIWYGEGYYLVEKEDDSTWYWTKCVKTPAQFLKELENKKKEVEKQIILIKSYLETSKNLVVYSPNTGHFEINVDDVEFVSKLGAKHYHTSEFYGTVYDLMMSGF